MQWFITVTDRIEPGTLQPLGVVAYNSADDDHVWVARRNEQNLFTHWDKIPATGIQSPPVAISGAAGIHVPEGFDFRLSLHDGYDTGIMTPIRRRMARLKSMIQAARISPELPWPPA